MHCIIVSVFNDQWSVFPKDGFVRGGSLAFSDRVGGGLRIMHYCIIVHYSHYALHCIALSGLSRQCSMTNDQCSGTII